MEKQQIADAGNGGQDRRSGQENRNEPGKDHGEEVTLPHLLTERGLFDRHFLGKALLVFGFFPLLRQAALFTALSRARSCAVRMNARENGESSIQALMSVYYMIKVSLAILVAGVHTPRKRRKGKKA